jgi:hypothetical protein
MDGVLSWKKPPGLVCRAEVCEGYATRSRCDRQRDDGSPGKPGQWEDGMTNKVVERVAQAIHGVDRSMAIMAAGDTGGPIPNWETDRESDRHLYRLLAKAAIAATHEPAAGMANEVVERVAQMVHDVDRSITIMADEDAMANAGVEMLPEWTSEPEHLRRLYRLHAKVAIAAMREPNAANGGTAYELDAHYWRTMMEAAPPAH